MYEPKLQIGVFLQRIWDSGGMSDSDALHLMVLTRELIEYGKQKGIYPILNFYCNWCLHTGLSGSMTCYRMLESITDVLLSEPPDIIAQISKHISLPELRKQIVTLYKSEGFPTFLFVSFHNWRHLCGPIIKRVLQKPIEFPNDPEHWKKSVKKIYTAMERKSAGRRGLMATRLWLSANLPNYEGEVWWCVQTDEHTQIRGALRFMESRQAFLSD